MLAALAVPGGTVRRYVVAAPALRDPHRAVRVYLPPSYFTPPATRRYPTLYLLHGWPGSDGNWLGMGRAASSADTLVARGEMPEAIVVFPNGHGPGLFGRSLYINSFDGSDRMEDFVVRDLVRWVDAHFRTVPKPAARALLGLSEGGTAALNLAFRHPDVFGACAGHSGDYEMTKAIGLSAVIGRGADAKRMLAENSPLLTVDRLAPRLHELVIYFDCGLADESLGDNRAFDRKLTSLGIAHSYHEFPGSHTWSYWRQHLRDSLKAVTAKMRAPSLAAS